ncbi:MAG: TonB-dependent receptor, partial [Candidatus Eremiobacteraeota bacterium]|nr:TonB-dependent receptor [Candidatus Eremiobacteraeota bacterium]
MSNTTKHIRRAIVPALVALLFLAQETWTLAGVSGNMAGIVRDPSGAPIAGATVAAISPSQQATTVTDGAGHFTFLALAPDTYTLNISKAGYQATSFPGNVVFADQTQQSTFTLSKSLKTIAHVTAAGAGALVKSGVGSDLYSVNAAQAAAAAPLGGGGDLNSAYSAMASVPGVQVNLGGAGWTFNAAYIRGAQYYNTGFEYDGIPINRAFDNYNASTESSLGLQELQVYTGGGPSSVASSGSSGFINQVIKTGTFPGYASGNVGIGSNSFYHQAQVEVGGATPDRNFSWYAGLSGYNQAFRFLNNDNGGAYAEPNSYYAGQPVLGNIIGYTASPTFTGQGVKTSCPLGEAPPASTPPQGCWEYYSSLGDNPSLVSDRENVVNLHFGIPKRNGLRDDVQALWSASALNNWSYSSICDIGMSCSQFFWSLDHAPYAAPTCDQAVTVGPGLTVKGCVPSKFGAYLPYADQVTYNLPFGTPIATSSGHITAPQVYYAPDTPQHQFDGPIPLADESITPYQNDTGIAKLQYTYALSSAAYLRAYGYTFYSDWLNTAPIGGATDQAITSLPQPQYDLMTHTAGAALNFNDQVDDQNLVSGDYNYTQASVVRFNNTSALAGAGTTPIGYMANGRCYNSTATKAGVQVPCLAGSYYCAAASCGIGSVHTSGCTPAFTGEVTDCWRSSAAAGPAGFSTPGVTWDTLWNGNATGSLNTVKPQFQNVAVSDQWRPNDKFLVNASLRYDNFNYVLPDSAGPADAFYANMTANYTCVQAATNQVLTAALAPGAPPPAPTQYVVGDCNAAAKALFPTGPVTGWVHPNGTKQDGVQAPDFTASSPGSYPQGYWEPRFSATYTESPDTVWRVSAGRYAQPPISASVQYLGASGDDRTVWNSGMNLGFYSPWHPIPGVSSAQYDLSYERHLTGTDMSLKVTPYYTWVNDWQQGTLIGGGGFVSQVPVGVNRNYGLEFQFTKGDFSRNGLSGLFSFTYSNAKVRFANEPLITGGTIPNTTIALNEAIAQYDQLTKGGGGSQCYQAGKAVGCSTPNGSVAKGFQTVLNPYYNDPVQGELDPNGWYNPYTTAIAPNLNGAIDSYISPAVASLIVNYRRDKLAVTPTVQFQAGGFYGSPLDVNGYDPRTCKLNEAGAGITALESGVRPKACDPLSAVAPG